MEGLLSDLNLFIRDNQKTTAPAVVFIHGFPFNHTMWAPQIQVLENDFRVVAYDQRGHGKSPTSSVAFVFESFVDDLFRLLDDLQIEKAVLCGLSMGGYVALRATERDDQRVSGLVLCDTKSAADPNAAKLKRAADLEFIRTQGLEAFADRFLKALFADKTLSAHPTLVHQVRQMMVSNPVKGVQDALVALATRTDTSEALAKFNIPTLIAVGEKDPITPLSDALALQEHIPNARLITLPDASHLSTLERSDLFNPALLAFLQPFRRS